MGLSRVQDSDKWQILFHDPGKNSWSGVKLGMSVLAKLLRGTIYLQQQLSLE